MKCQSGGRSFNQSASKSLNEQDGVSASIVNECARFVMSPVGPWTEDPPEPGHVTVFNGSFEEYKDKLRREFEGGSLLSNKKRAERREKEAKEAAAKKDGGIAASELGSGWGAAKGSPPAPQTPTPVAATGTITLERPKPAGGGGGVAGAGATSTPREISAPVGMVALGGGGRGGGGGGGDGGGGYVPPHLRRQRPEEIPDAWDDD